jgi:hypothetical protein
MNLNLSQELPHFIEKLRVAGYNISTNQLMAVQDLMLTLAAQGQLPTELRRFRTLLGPILCHSSKEQTEFNRHFEEWTNTFEIKSTLKPKTILEKIKHYIRRFKLALFIIGISIFFISIIFIYFPNLTKLTIGPIETPPKVTVPIDPKTQTPSENSANDESISINETEPSEIPATGTTRLDQTEPSNQPSPTTFKIQNNDLKDILLLTWDLWLQLLFLSFMLVWLLKYLGSLLFGFLKYFLGQRFLNRKSYWIPPETQHIEVKDIDNKLFKLVGLSWTAQQLRKHISIPTTALDIEATIKKSIETNWFVPVTGTLKTRPDYLVLIDRTTFRDHQAELVNALIQQMIAEDVAITRYYFDADPRYCYPEQNTAAPLTLVELANHYPEHRLMIFSEGNGLLNPITGELVNWIEQFSAWHQPALFTPETPEQWGYREHILRDNFLILPATETGLTVFAELMNLHSPHSQSKDRSLYQREAKGDFNLEDFAPFPEYLHERPRRWLERHAPNATMLAELLQQIYAFLGKDGYYWFSACALYPEIKWKLTLYLGNHLQTADGHKLLTNKRLAKIARLPWFRYGYMPDWLRERLRTDLFRSEYRTVSNILELKENISDKKASIFSLEFVSLIKNLQNWWAQLFSKSTQSVSETDNVFETFRQKKGSVRAPKIKIKQILSWQRRLFDWTRQITIKLTKRIKIGLLKVGQLSIKGIRMLRRLLVYSANQTKAFILFLIHQLVYSANQMKAFILFLINQLVYTFNQAKTYILFLIHYFTRIIKSVIFNEKLRLMGEFIVLIGVLGIVIQLDGDFLDYWKNLDYWEKQDYSNKASDEKLSYWEKQDYSNKASDEKLSSSPDLKKPSEKMLSSSPVFSKKQSDEMFIYFEGKGTVQIESIKGMPSDFSLKRHGQELGVAVSQLLKVGDQIKMLQKNTSITLLSVKNERITLKYKNTKKNIYWIATHGEKGSISRTLIRAAQKWWASLWAREPQENQVTITK